LKVGVDGFIDISVFFLQDMQDHLLHPSSEEELVPGGQVSGHVLSTNYSVFELSAVFFELRHAIVCHGIDLDMGVIVDVLKPAVDSISDPKGKNLREP
jgi:hypothetical protein